MNFDKYVITEFSDDVLAIRKRFNELFESSEVQTIKEELQIRSSVLVLINTFSVTVHIEQAEFLFLIFVFRVVAF